MLMKLIGADIAESGTMPKFIERLEMSILQKLVYWTTIKPRLNRLKKLLPEARIHPAGSRYVCNPPSMFTDIDFLVYTEKSTETFLTLVEAGYIKTEMKDYFRLLKPAVGEQFDAWRRGKVNLVVTNVRQYAETYHTATYICKVNNVIWKSVRIDIHETVRGTFDYEAVGAMDLFGYNHLKPLLLSFNGPHGNAVHKAYRAKHGLEL